MRFFDTHAHLGLIHSDKIERMLTVRTALAKGVDKILSVTNTLSDFNDIYSSLSGEKSVYFAVGISPLEVQNADYNSFTKLENLLNLEKVIAIGETGLDYSKNNINKDLQAEFFLNHIKIAEKYNKTLIVHNREAGRDVARILRDSNVKTNIIFHCYSENLAFAESVADLPIYFSFAGNLTYRTVRDLHETVSCLPPERILIESESPFMVPALYKGKRNKPQYISETIKTVAYYQNRDVEEMAEIVYNNSLNAFRLQ